MVLVWLVVLFKFMVVMLLEFVVFLQLEVIQVVQLAAGVVVVQVMVMPLLVFKRKPLQILQ